MDFHDSENPNLDNPETYESNNEMGEASTMKSQEIVNS